MMFRYKATPSYDVWSDKLSNYNFIIEIYQPNKIKKWQKFEYTSLTLILRTVFHDVKFSVDLSPEQWLNVIKTNGGVDKIMKDYINIELKNQDDANVELARQQSVIDELNTMLCSNKWTTIDISMEE